MAPEDLDRRTLAYIRRSAFRTSIHRIHGLLYFRAVRDAIASGDIHD